MIVDIFLRTYDRDSQWLPFLFRSLVCHARGFRQLIVVTPEDSLVVIKPVVERFAPMLLFAGAVTSFRVETCDHWPDDYAGQQLSKLQAWQYSSADEVLYLDSDLVLIRGVTPFTRRGPIEVRLWADAGEAVRWKNSTEQLLGLETPYETMCRHPFQYSVQLVRRCYEHIGGAARLLTVCPPPRHFSEFNLIGSYAHLVEQYPVMLTTDDDWQTDVVKQFYSVGGITAEVEVYLRQLGLR